MPGIWSLGKPLGHFHTDEGILQDSILNAKASKSSSKSNYLRSSAALDMSPVDCSELLLESSLLSTQGSRQLWGLSIWLNKLTTLSLSMAIQRITVT